LSPLFSVSEPCGILKEEGYMIYVSNSFSLSMLTNFPACLRVREVSLEDVKKLLSCESNFVSAVGHQATADLLTKLLNIQIPFNRVQISLNSNDILIVFQLQTRLEEGKILTEQELQHFQYKFLLVINDTPIRIYIGGGKNRRRK
jgi:hypothetical protein